MLTVAAVAEKLDVSRKHVYRLIHNGELKALLVGKRALRVTSESFAAFLKGRETCRSEKTIVDAGTSKYVTGGREFIESALKTRQRHRLKPSKPKSARIYSLPAPETQTS